MVSYVSLARTTTFLSNPTQSQFNTIMGTALLELNEAQKLIYTRSNISRAFPEFDDADVAGIYLHEDSCRVVYRDGAEVDYPRQQIKDSFVVFTKRLKNFFSYLGPNYRGPSIWHHNAYIMFKGWCYTHSLGHRTFNAQLQAQWADKFIHLSDQVKLRALLQSDQTDLGYLVAPDGFQIIEQARLGSCADSEEDADPSTQKTASLPSCSCGSFQRQLNHLEELQQEIPGYQPSCIHLTWFKKYRDLLCRRTEIRNACPAYAPDKCVAWWYAPPSDATGKGRFLLLHTKHGAQAPITHWRTYKPSEVFTEDDAWSLFDNMMEAGYVPFPGVSLPQLKNHEAPTKSHAS